jgi:replicative DNA helicase
MARKKPVLRIPEETNVLSIYLGSMVDLSEESGRPSMWASARLDIKEDLIDDPFFKGFYIACKECTDQGLTLSPRNIANILTLEMNEGRQESQQAFEQLVADITALAKTRGAADESEFRKYEALIVSTFQQKSLENIPALIQQLQDDGYTPSDSLEAVAEFARQGINDVHENQIVVTTTNDLIKSAATYRDQQLLKLNKPMRGFPVSWGLGSLIPFIMDNTLVTIAAPSSNGKSTASMQMATECVRSGGEVVYIFNEDTPETINARNACRYSTIPTSVELIIRGDETGAVAEYGRMLEKWAKKGGGMTLINAQAASPKNILRRLRRQLINMQAEGRKPDFVFLDYLQKVAFGKALLDNQNTVTIINEFIDDFMALVTSFGGIPVVLSQVSVDANGEMHTKDTKALEEKSQYVIKIIRNVIKKPEDIEKVTFEYEGQTVKDEILAGLKQRSYLGAFEVTKNSTLGPLGTVEMIHVAHRFSFYSLSFLDKVDKDPNYRFEVPMLRSAEPRLIERVKRRDAAVTRFTEEQVKAWRNKNPA